MSAYSRLRPVAVHSASGQPCPERGGKGVDERFAEYAQRVLPRMAKGSAREVESDEGEVVAVWVDGDLPLRLPRKCLNRGSEPVGRMLPVENEQFIDIKRPYEGSERFCIDGVLSGPASRTVTDDAEVERDRWRRLADGGPTVWSGRCPESEPLLEARPGGVVLITRQLNPGWPRWIGESFAHEAHPVIGKFE